MRSLEDLHSKEYKRFTFYFPVGDESAIEEYLIVPNHKNPGEVRDLHFKFCGQKLKRSSEFNEFVETTVPDKFKDRFSKSEKGIDIEICCDAFRLASASRIERLFLFTNDDDFIPFCRTIKEFGANISIIHLSATANKNISLLKQADSYDVVPYSELQAIFLPAVPETVPHNIVLPSDEEASLKPDAAPSDLNIANIGAADQIDDSSEES